MKAPIKLKQSRRAQLDETEQRSEAGRLSRMRATNVALVILLGLACSAAGLRAQPAYTAPAPEPRVVEDPAERRAGYLARVHEVMTWRASQAKPDNPATLGLAEIAAKLALRQDAAACSERLVELLKKPSGDMFWMFPVTCISYLGRDQLSPAAKAAMREAWRTYMPLRGDTENHWLMYYTSLYLMAQLWPNEPGDRWFHGKSSEEIFAEARDYLIHWTKLTTTIGQGEYDCTHYLGEYSIPLLFLSTWAKDPGMRQRARMMLDYVLADYAVDTLNGLDCSIAGARRCPSRDAPMRIQACRTDYLRFIVRCIRRFHLGGFGRVEEYYVRHEQAPAAGP